jgi:hypothetical protein
MAYGLLMQRTIHFFLLELQCCHKILSTRFRVQVRCHLHKYLSFVDQTLLIYNISGTNYYPPLITTFPLFHSSSICYNRLLYNDNTVYVQDFEHDLIEALNVSNPLAPVSLWVVPNNHSEIFVSCGPSKLTRKY